MLEPFHDVIDPDALLREAELATGLGDWGGSTHHETRFRERLKAICASFENESALTPIGRTRAHSWMHASLCTRLEVVNWHTEHADLARPIRAPLIGTGSGRAGTSFTHQLLSQDPLNRAPSIAEGIIPVSSQNGAQDAERVTLVDSFLEFQGLFTPEVDAIHPFGAEQTAECTVTQHSAIGTLYQAFFNMPGYLATAWTHYDDFFDWEGKVLQILQTGKPEKRWILKSPENLGHFQAMMSAFPEAKVYLNHRDPAKIVASQSSLLQVFCGLNSGTSIDPTQVGPVVCRHFADYWAKAMAWRDAHPEMKFVDVHYKTLIADPVAEAERIYGEFGLSLCDEARGAMDKFLRVNRHGHGAAKHDYQLEDFGLTMAMIDDAYGPYMERYGIVHE
jgi:hypothetical protein